MSSHSLRTVFPGKLCCFVLGFPEISLMLFYVFVLSMGQGLAPCTMRLLQVPRREPECRWLTGLGSEDDVDVASTNRVATPSSCPGSA